MPPPSIGIPHAREEPVGPYSEAVEEAGGTPVPLSMEEPIDTEATLEAIDGLLLTGGADVDPIHYGEEADPDANVRARPKRDATELPLIRAALDQDKPVLAICRGMQALNVVLGGKLVQDLPGHRAQDPEEPVLHEIFVPPGARLTVILGSGGFMKVNSMHHQGVRWAQKAPDVMVSAYSLKDGIIEAIESPRHRWVLGVQWHPERRDEVPKSHQKLFQNLVWASQEKSDPA